MKNKYNPIINCTNDKNSICWFGCFYDYYDTKTIQFKLFSIYIVAKVYKLILKPTINKYYHSIDVDRETITTHYNNYRLYSIQSIKQHSNIFIKLFDIIVSIKINDNKKYNKDKAFSKLENIVLI